jgi:PKD repeat protein
VGVAPGARLWAVRVLGNNGSGTFSQIVCGLDWVRAQGNIEVVNMSLSGSGTDGSCGNSTFHNAVCNLKNAGTTIVVAAGNSSADASGEVPAAYEQVITVSALADFNGLAGGGAAPTCRSDVDDTFANFSNYGSDVDLIAPGVCILSTSRTGGTTTMSGTSMAAPHVAGAAGLYKASNPSATPDEVRSALIAAGNSNWNDADDPDSTKEPLLAVGTVGGVTPAEEPPTPNFTFSCTNLACNFTDTSTATDGDAITGQLWEFGSGGATSTAQNPTFNYPSGGTYAVKLTVTDNDGSDSITKNVTVTAAETQVPPTPNFTFSCTNLTCSFTDTSATTNGDAITSRSWSFGSGGATSTAQNPSFTYPSDGTYSVQLTVADNDGSASVTKSVTVTAPLPVNIQLSVSKSGWWYWINANLSWNGATGSSVDVHRRPSSSSTWTLITTTANDGSYSERPGSGTWVYRVCLQGSTTTCSNEATVSI